MPDIIVIEPGTRAWAHIAEAVQTGRKLSINPRGEGAFAIKVGEGMWSATLVSGLLDNEPPANT